MNLSYNQPVTMHNTSPYLEGTNDIIPCGSACEALNFLQQIYHSAPVCMLAIDSENRVIRLNQRLADFAGKDVSDCPGLPLSELLPAAASQLKAIAKQVLKSGLAVLNQEINFSETEQKFFWAVNAYPVTYEQTGSITVSLIINDISELRNTQIGLEKAYQDILTLQEKLKQENQVLKNHLSYNFDDNTMLGSSPSLKQVLFQIHKVAPTDATVMITGDTGTGKELAAREIHRCSRRANQPLIVVNCAALPANLIESELFGHEKGAFTGAIARKIGRFEVASGGSIFLDEIGEMPLELQSKLLRVISGSVLDVAVDLREGSPTFGKHVAVELTGENHRQLFIPRGFAHGFGVLSREALFQYKCDNFYAPSSEGAIAWDDPDLGIDWRIPAADVILSEKDRRNPTFKEYCNER